QSEDLVRLVVKRVLFNLAHQSALFCRIGLVQHPLIEIDRLRILKISILHGRGVFACILAECGGTGAGTKLRSCQLNKRRTECDVKQADLAWSVPVMRVGYAGRGLVYLTVGGFSLYAIWRGEQPQGTASTLSQLETTGWGSMILLLIFLGTLAFAVWNV